MADTLKYASSPRPSSPSSNQNNPLTLIIRRLEAATSRLEDIASSSTTFEALDNGKIAQGNAPRASAPNLPGTAVSGSPAIEAPKPAAPELPPAIKEMDELIEGEVKKFVEASKGIDPLVEGQVGRIYPRSKEDNCSQQYRPRPQQRPSATKGASLLPRLKPRSPI
jgi:hypothetical protein